ncbi:hypothetical protein EG329_001811 [Mollisiaceae sp. DMI_Dod_QoI]|nr:hypothetical protein EG329_001811 [Helotiales sp. DMI_Dod_QoI]
MATTAFMFVTAEDESQRRVPLLPPEGSLWERLSNRSFCKCCRKILQHVAKVKLESSGLGYTKGSIAFGLSELLKDAHGKDCTLCLLFFGSEIRNAMRQHEGSAFGDENNSLIGHEQLWLEITMRLRYVENSRHALHLVLKYWPASYSERFGLTSKYLVFADPTAAYFGTPYNITESSAPHPSNNSAHGIALANRWLHACSRYHKRCLQEQPPSQFPTDGYRLPTRLIDIGTRTPLQPRLRDSLDLPQDSSYLTLSHCWGAFLPKRLLSTNIHAMKQSLILSELSRTFQDAMMVTRQLGMRYIWIDSLCIIQDSPEDWQKESVQMCNIYSYSFCNLCATASADGSGGLFQDRDIRTLKPVRLTARGAKHIIVDSEIWTREVDEAPLNRRAWVCQERNLAPRNLHFAATQVFWECNEAAACEAFPQGFPSGIITNLTTETRQRLAGLSVGAVENFKALDSPPHERTPHPYAVWGSIVEDYTRSMLTHETDKLIAIGGIAAKVQSVLNDTYLAGLWLRNLAGDLLWECEKWDDVKPKQYIAPSWSWASVIGKVCNVSDIGSKEGRDLIEVISTRVELETTNPFGQVKSGTISLRGKLFHLAIKPRIFGSAIWAECLVQVDLLLYINVNNVDRMRVYRQHNYLYGLLIKDYSNCRESANLKGLLLEATSRAGEFRRIGTFDAWEEDVVSIVKAGIQCFDARASQSGLEYTDDREGGYKYTISLI